MKSRMPKRTSLASSALICGLVLFAPLAAAQGNVCFSSGWNHRPGILEASLNGKMVPALSGNKLEIEIPEAWEENIWSRTTDSRDEHNVPTTYPVFVASNTILVPTEEVALIWLEIEPPATSPPPPWDITKIKFEDESGTNIVDLSAGFQPAVSAILVKKDGANIIIFCDNNQRNDDHTWEFSVLINGDWYDPQIKNKGAGAPPPPPTP